ncbi:MAG: hypothetical protein IH946_04085 [Bacteroidetes bacterium]|nr:hypothetical protein [Bacteroidota bacterium]
MFGIKKIGILIMSVVMLGILAGIFTTNILCNFAHAVDASGQEHDHPYGHDHHHESSVPPAEHDHKDKGSDHDHHSTNGCCKDFTLTFFSSLQRVYEPTFKLNSKVISFAISLHILINPVSEKDLFKGVRDYIEPPPKLSDIRVFIQSYQI